jgi:hypothetical protein
MRKKPGVVGAELSAVNLKLALWHTLKEIKAGRATPGSGAAIAAQAREILRTARIQLLIFSQAGGAVSRELIDFAKPPR